MKSIIYCITLLVSLSMAQTSTVNDRFAGFDPFVANIVVNIFSDMNIITSDCPEGIANSFAIDDGANSSRVVCGLLSLGDALGLFSNAWNQAFGAHTQNWNAMSPWDSSVIGDLQTVTRSYTYIGMSEVFSLSVVYVSNGMVVVFTDVIGYTP